MSNIHDLEMENMRLIEENKRLKQALRDFSWETYDPEAYFKEYQDVFAPLWAERRLENEA